MAIALKEPPPLRNFRPDAPAGLERAIVKCLAKDREKRYRNVAEMALDLVEFGPKRARASFEKISGIIQAAGLSASALALPPSSDPTTREADGGTVPSWGGTSPGARRVPKTIGWLVAAVLVLGVAGGLWVRGKRQSSNDGSGTGGGPSSLSTPAPAVQPPPPVVLPIASEAAQELPVTAIPPTAEPSSGAKEQVRGQSGFVKKPSAFAKPSAAASVAATPSVPSAKPSRAQTHASADDINRFLTDPK